MTYELNPGRVGSPAGPPLGHTRLDARPDRVPVRCCARLEPPAEVAGYDLTDRSVIVRVIPSIRGSSGRDRAKCPLGGHRRGND